MLDTKAGLFAEWLQVSLVENVHLTKHMKKLNVTLSLIIFVRMHSGKDTKRMCQGMEHHIGRDEGEMLYLWLCLYENMPAETQIVTAAEVIDKWLQCREFEWLSSFVYFFF